MLIYIKGALSCADISIRKKCLKESKDADLCLKVKFANDKDIAVLYQVGSTCTFKGQFLGSSARVFVSANECPLEQDSSFDVTSFFNNL